MNVLGLFSGIGGFELGLERAGMHIAAMCEIDPYCRAVLRKHWPNVPIYEDVRSLTADSLRPDGIVPDAICGGFPCQDISNAGKRAGIDGSRSGLWSEVTRITSEVRPSILILENVSALLSGPSERPGAWFGRVLGDLAALGYDAEWHCIPAYYVGSPQTRDRIWIVAHPSEGPARAWGDARMFKSEKINWPRLVRARGSRRNYGLPDWVDRIGAVGNAVHPAIPEIIGRAIMTSSPPSGARQGVSGSKPERT